MNHIDIVSNGSGLVSVLSSVADVFSSVVMAVSQQEVRSDYQSGSGLTTNALANAAKGIAVSFAIILGVWGIIAELRAWGTDGGDSFDLGSTVIRGSILSLFIGVVLSIIN